MVRLKIHVNNQRYWKGKEMLYRKCYEKETEMWKGMYWPCVVYIYRSYCKLSIRLKQF